MGISNKKPLLYVKEGVESLCWSEEERRELKKEKKKVCGKSFHCGDEGGQWLICLIPLWLYKNNYFGFWNSLLKGVNPLFEMVLPPIKSPFSVRKKGWILNRLIWGEKVVELVCVCRKKLLMRKGEPLIYLFYPCDYIKTNKVHLRTNCK